MDNLLLVDIGGTNMRTAVANTSKDKISEIEKSSFDPDNFDSFLEKLINKHDSNALILSVAGPKINNVISMTNQEYTFDPIKIKDKFSLKECFLLNDWEAIAYSYDYIKDSVEYIKKGEPFNQNRLFVGPGTGLGAALSINNQTVLPTEIGNTTNASSLLQKNFNLSSEDNLNLEKIISGTAIASIYNLKTGNTISSEEIFEKFIKNDADAVFVIDGFLKSLAETLSDLSLTYSSGNGILLAGSLIRSLYPYIDKKAFIENFMANKYQSHKKMLELVSIGVITKERTPLYGNLGFYKNLNKS